MFLLIFMILFVFQFTVDKVIDFFQPPKGVQLQE